MGLGWGKTWVVFVELCDCCPGASVENPHYQRLHYCELLVGRGWFEFGQIRLKLDWGGLYIKLETSGENRHCQLVQYCEPLVVWGWGRGRDGSGVGWMKHELLVGWVEAGTRAPLNARPDSHPPNLTRTHTTICTYLTPPGCRCATS